MYSVDKYKRAYTLARIIDTDLAMLRAQYYAHNRTVTAPQLAQICNFTNHRLANLRYGLLGKKFAYQLEDQPSQCSPENRKGWFRYISSGLRVGPDYFWTMRPFLAQALEELHVVKSEPNNLARQQLGFSSSDEVNEDVLYPEGAVRKVTVNAYERSPQARQECIDIYGTRCSACSFDFGRVYGPDGEGYTQVHHLRPLSEIGERYQVSPQADLRPVCANCHAMIHRRTPAYSIKEVQQMIRNAQAR